MEWYNRSLGIARQRSIPWHEKVVTDLTFRSVVVQTVEHRLEIEPYREGTARKVKELARRCEPLSA